MIGILVQGYCGLWGQYGKFCIGRVDDNVLQFDDKGVFVRFQVNCDVFSEVVFFVVKFFLQCNLQLIFVGVLIEVDGFGFILLVFDYEVLVCIIIEVIVEILGMILVYGCFFFDIVSWFLNVLIEIVVEDDGGIVVICGFV